MLFGMNSGPFDLTQLLDLVSVKHSTVWTNATKRSLAIVISAFGSNSYAWLFLY